jgi:hypothetical protein
LEPTGSGGSGIVFQSAALRLLEDTAGTSGTLAALAGNPELLLEITNVINTFAGSGPDLTTGNLFTNTNVHVMPSKHDVNVNENDSYCQY